MSLLTSWLPSNPFASAPPAPTDSSVTVEEGAEISTLPKYNTFNDLAPEFQLTEEHDENHIFPKEHLLVEELRKLCPEAEEWPSRYLLIFLFARRHSLPHTVHLLRKHIKWLSEMGCRPITKTNLYPFSPEQLSENEMKYALFSGFTVYKHRLVDKHNRLLRYQIMRHFFPGEHNLKDYMLTTVWWYYSTFQFVPLSIHRNGHSVVVDMKGMGWNNISFSLETQKTLMFATSSLPGRMRVCWMVNTNWMLSSAMTVARYVLSEKIIGRIKTITEEELLNEIPAENLPTELGGSWTPDLRKEWYEKSLELDRQALNETLTKLSEGGDHHDKKEKKQLEEEQKTLAQ